MITIIDYGVGNLMSIKNILKKAGFKSLITSDVNEISKADKIILPGVGSFDAAMKNIEMLKLDNVLNRKVILEQIPILGICLGMQIMCNSSEEGSMKGLSWIDADVKRFVFADKKYKIPHMGWNVVIPNDNSIIFENKDDLQSRFYHVHSYYVKLKNQDLELAYAEYDFKFTTAFRKENIFGVQFHPEKSHKYGLELLRKFAQL